MRRGMERYIIPDAFDEKVAKNVAKAVSKAAIKSGVAKITGNGGDQ